MARISRRTFFLSALAGITGPPCYARFLEPEWLEVTHKRVPVPGGKLRREVRILHLSDLHASDAVPFSLIARAIELGMAEQPDFAALTGDFITRSLPDAGQYVETLRPLAARMPTFACFGNHDGGRWLARHGGYSDPAKVREVLEAAGVTCLRNEALVHQDLQIVGVGDLWSRDVDAEAAFGAAEAPGEFPTIVLAHNPDTRMELDGQRWDLMLSGHTHGGQIVVPVIDYKPFVAVSDERFLEGLQPWEGRLIHITRGVGNLLGVRLNCRPEVSLLTLTNG